MPYLTDRQAQIVKTALDAYRDQAIGNMALLSGKTDAEFRRDKKCFTQHIQNLINKILRLTQPANLNLLWITPKDGSPDQQHLIVNEDLLLQGYTNLEIEELSKEKGIYRIEFVITRDRFVFSHGDDWEYGSVIRGELPHES